MTTYRQSIHQEERMTRKTDLHEAAEIVADVETRKAAGE